MNAPDVFVSYASQDRDRIEDLVLALEAAGLSVWWDRHIHTGRAFDREIERALDAARCVVVVWSLASVESDWVRTEAAEGLERNILVPLRIDEVKPPLAFRRLQTLDSVGTAATDWAQIVRAVRDLMPDLPAPKTPIIDTVPTPPSPNRQIRTRPRIALSEPAFSAADAALQETAQVVQAEVTSYLQAGRHYEVVASGAGEIDYQINLRFAGSSEDGRVVLQLTGPAQGYSQTARASIHQTMTPDRCEWLASALFRNIQMNLRRDMILRLKDVPDDELDFQGLLWGTADLGVKPDSRRQYERILRAVSLRPDSGYAHAELARTRILLRNSDGVRHPGTRLDEIRAVAQRAVELAPTDPFVLNACSYTLSQTGDASMALALVEEAAQILPAMQVGMNFPLVRLGRTAQALEMLNRFSCWDLPALPEAWSAWAEAYAVNEDYQSVVEVAMRGLQRARSQRLVLRGHYANALAMLGHKHEALVEWSRIREDAAGFTVAGWRRAWQLQMADASLTGRLVAGLELLETDG